MSTKGKNRSTFNTAFYGNLVTAKDDCGPTSKGGFFRGRHPLERVEFEEWAEGFGGFEEFTF